MPNVKRWDVYDAADHLDDYEGALFQAFQKKDWNAVLQIGENISEWTSKLWAMSVREGTVGPFPFYENVISDTTGGST